MNPATDAVKRIMAAFRKIRCQPVAVGDAAFQAWGAGGEAGDVELLSPTGEKQRLALTAAAVEQQFRPEEAPEGTLRFRHPSALIRIQEASTPYLRQVLVRAEPGVVLETRILLASVEDLVLLRAGSKAPGHRDRIVALLRAQAGKFDGPYLKREGEAAGTFDPIKSAWQEAKQGG